MKFTRAQKLEGERAEIQLSEKAQWYIERTEGAGLWKTDEGFYTTWGISDCYPSGPKSFEEANADFEAMTDELMQFEAENAKEEEE